LSIEYIFILYIENDPSQPKLTSKALSTMFTSKYRRCYWIIPC